MLGLVIAAPAIDYERNVIRGEGDSLSTTVQYSSTMQSSGSVLEDFDWDMDRLSNKPLAERIRAAEEKLDRLYFQRDVCPQLEEEIEVAFVEMPLVDVLALVSEELGCRLPVGLPQGSFVVESSNVRGMRADDFLDAVADVCGLELVYTRDRLVFRRQLVTTPVSPAALLRWKRLGTGTAEVEGDGIRLAEGENSKGVMLTSPKAYGDNVALMYDVKPENSDTVLVAVLSASDPGEATRVTIPEGYDGAMTWLVESVENYFFAFCNRAHEATPFVRRYPQTDGGKDVLASYESNLMEPGRWYRIEVGRESGRLWLTIDDNTILDVTDEAPLGGGHLALRIRGTATGRASCLIRDLAVRAPRVP